MTWRNVRHFTHVTSSIDFTGSYNDIRTAYDNVEKWSAIQKADFNLTFWAMSPKIRPEPKGVVLIIAPFNGPVIMLFSPLVSSQVILPERSSSKSSQTSQVGALAGGNTAVLKPSEQASATAVLVAELVPKYLDNDLVQVINGGVSEMTKVSQFFPTVYNFD